MGGSKVNSQVIVLDINKNRKVNECNVSEVFIKNTGNTAFYFMSLKIVPNESHYIALNAVIDLDTDLSFLPEGTNPKAYVRYVKHLTH